MADPIVTTDWLSDHLGDENLSCLEVSMDPGRSVYEAGHIPGAHRCYWKNWCWHATDRQMISPEKMAERLAANGIGPETKLVLYGDPVQFGTYAYWAFYMAGHRNLFLLDGGREKWVTEGRAMTTEIPTPRRVVYPVPPVGDCNMRIGRDDVLAHLQDKGRVLLDARTPEEYNGTRVMPEPNFDHGAERYGRIPGAAHFYYQDLLTEDNSFKSAQDLEALFRAAGAAPDQTREVAVYCRLSHRATLVWVAAKYILGWDHVKIYDGSWTEWGSIVGMPVEL